MRLRCRMDKPLYSYAAPFAQYEDVLKRYAEWVLSLEDKVDAVVSIHDPILELWRPKAGEGSRATSPATAFIRVPKGTGLSRGSCFACCLILRWSKRRSMSCSRECSALFTAVLERHRTA